MTTPRDLILVRHGESEHHVRGLTGGWTDTALTDRGRYQAERVGRALAATSCQADTWFLSSDLLRARQTAEIIAKHTGIRPEFHAKLRELNNGAAKNKTLEEAKQIALPLTKPAVDWGPYPEAESWRTMTNRLMAFLATVIDRTEKDSVLIVSHGNAMIAIVHWWLQLDQTYWSSISYDFDCGSITHLSVNQWAERAISKLNDISHLKDSGVLEQRAPDAADEPCC